MSYLYRLRQKDPKGHNVRVYQGSGTPCANKMVPKQPGDMYFDTTAGSAYISQVWYDTCTAYATKWQVIQRTKAP
jgi:hypothetical protein